MRLLASVGREVLLSVIRGVPSFALQRPALVGVAAPRGGVIGFVSSVSGVGGRISLGPRPLSSVWTRGAAIAPTERTVSA